MARSKNAGKILLQLKIEEETIARNAEYTIFSEREVYMLCLDYFNKYNFHPRTRKLISTENPSLIKSIYHYFGNFPHPLGKLYHLCLIESSHEPVCIKCKRPVIYNFKTGFRDLCSSCARKESTQQYKIKNNTEHEHEKYDYTELKIETENFIKSYYDINTYKPNFYSSIRKQKGKTFIKQIIHRTNYLNTNCKFNERLYHIINDLTSKVLCSVCGSGDLKFKRFSIEDNKCYNLTCSTKCMGKIKTEEQIKKGSITKRSKYFPKLKERLLQRNMKVISNDEEYILQGNFTIECLDCGCIFNRSLYDKTDCDAYCVCIPPNERTQNTKLKRYGDKFYRNADKARQTCVERYGVEHISHNEIISSKSKKEC